jgi:hypothetical protein
MLSHHRYSVSDLVLGLGFADDMIPQSYGCQGRKDTALTLC